MYCMKCGNQIDDNANVCPKCGHEIIQSVNNSNIPNQKKSFNKLLIAIPCMIIAIMSAIVISVVLIFSNSSFTSNELDELKAMMEKNKYKQVVEPMTEQTPTVIPSPTPSLTPTPTPTPSPTPTPVVTSTPTLSPDKIYETYVNKYFGITCKYPKSFKTGHSNASLEVINFTDEENDMYMAIYAANNSTLTVQRMKSILLSEMKGRVEYQANGDDWLALSTTDGYKCKYVKCFVDDKVRYFTFEYRPEYDELAQEYINYIEDNFKRLD